MDIITPRLRRFPGLPRPRAEDRELRWGTADFAILRRRFASPNDARLERLHSVDFFFGKNAIRATVFACRSTITIPSPRPAGAGSSRPGGGKFGESSIRGNSQAVQQIPLDKFLVEGAPIGNRCDTYVLIDGNFDLPDVCRRIKRGLRKFGLLNELPQ